MTNTNKKMTNAQFKAFVLTAIEGMAFTEELTKEMFTAKLEVLTKAKAPSKKVTLEKEMLLENLKSVLSETTPKNGSEIAEEMKVFGMELTAQKVTANMKILVDNGEVVKIAPVKRSDKVTYALAGYEVQEQE